MKQRPRAQLGCTCFLKHELLDGAEERQSSKGVRTTSWGTKTWVLRRFSSQLIGTAKQAAIAVDKALTSGVHSHFRRECFVTDFLTAVCSNLQQSSQYHSMSHADLIFTSSTEINRYNRATFSPGADGADSVRLVAHHRIRVHTFRVSDT